MIIAHILQMFVSAIKLFWTFHKRKVVAKPLMPTLLFASV